MGMLNARSFAEHDHEWGQWSLRRCVASHNMTPRNTPICTTILLKVMAHNPMPVLHDSGQQILQQSWFRSANVVCGRTSYPTRMDVVHVVVWEYARTAICSKWSKAKAYDYAYDTRSSALHCPLFLASSRSPASGSRSILLFAYHTYPKQGPTSTSNNTCITNLNTSQTTATHILPIAIISRMQL